MLQSKWILTIFEACQSFFSAALEFSLLCFQSGQIYGLPGALLWRDCWCGMKYRGEEPNHNSSFRPLPSAQCLVCSPHELGRMLPEHHSHPSTGVIVRISRCWTWAGDVTPAGVAGGLAKSCSWLWDSVSISFRGRNPVEGGDAWFDCLHVRCLHLPWHWGLDLVSSISTRDEGTSQL